MNRLLAGLTVLVLAAATASLGCDPNTETTADEEIESSDVTGSQDSLKADVNPASQESPPTSAPLDFSENVAAVRPAVVNIYTRTAAPTQSENTPALPPGMVPEGRVRESLGSGFIFDSQGLVLTNHHVIADATEISVRLLDERVYPAELVGTDPPTDVAVLQLKELDDEKLPFIILGDSDQLQVGNWVLAIGNPLGLTSTVTAGIISASGRQLMPPGGQLRFQDFIQTDASINHGSSGGPLINTSQEAVGIATALSAAGQGLGFAIPINMVHEILPDLLEHGRVERSWLGIYIGAVPDRLREELDLPDQGGAFLTRLVEDGPAEAAGLQPGDILLAIDNEKIEDTNHISWLAATIGVDETVDMLIQRGDEELVIPLTMGMLPQQ